MFKLPDPLAVRVMLRGLLVPTATEEVGVVVAEALMVAREVPMERTSC
jgi:hypothetical protein